MVKGVVKRKVKAVSKSEAKVKNIVNSAIARSLKKQDEIKHYSAGAGTANMSTTFSVVKLSGMANGTTDITRIGDRVRPTSMIFRFSLQGNVANNVNICRVVLFQFNSDSTTAPISADVFEDTTNANTMIYGPLSKDRFGTKLRPIADYTVTLQNATTAAPNLKFFQIRKSLKMYKSIAYLAGTTEGLGNIYACFIGDQASTYATCAYYSMIYYRDS